MAELDVGDHESSAGLRQLIVERLKDSRPPVDASRALAGGLLSNVDPKVLRGYFPASPVAAAVLMPLIEHPEGISVLLTERASTLKNHAGQISFPGGRIEAADGGPAEAALREAEEEIGLPRQHVTIAGYLDPHLVLTGFWVTPVVGFVRPGFVLQLDRREVASTFEVPLTHILDPANHCARERLIGDASVQVHDIPYGDHNIWGATAGMLMSLYRLLTQPIVTK